MMSINGMPMMAIVLPTGRGVANTWENMSASSDRQVPTVRVAGITLRCMEEPMARRAMCGATIPTKPIGPQKAVTAPVMMQLPAIAIFLILSMLAPASAAYSSPNKEMSSPLELHSAMKIPIARAESGVSP